MKKYVSVLMVLLAAFMFFTCDNGDGGGGGSPSPVIPKTLTLKGGDSHTFTSTVDFTLWVSPDDEYTVEVNDKTITGLDLGTATVIAKDGDKELAKCIVTVITPLVIKLDLNPASWGTLPTITFNADWPKTPAASSYNNGAVTFTYNRNRQIAIIPLTNEQVEKLDNLQFLQTKRILTIRIDSEVTVGTPKPNGYEYFIPASAGFRTHLADVSVAAGVTPTWNATSGADAGEAPLTDQQVKVRALDHAYDVQDLDPPRSNFKHFIIQAMFQKSDGTTGFVDADTVFPDVIVTVKSITIEVGDTRTAEERGE